MSQNKSGRDIYTIMVDGKEIEVRVVSRKGNMANTRIYGLVDVFSTVEDTTQGKFVYDEKTQPEMWARLTAEEKVEMEADLKAYKDYRKNALKQAREGLKRVMNNPEVADVFEGMNRINFSQNAGCSSCPCSPGHVTNKKVYAKGAYNTADIFIDLAK